MKLILIRHGESEWNKKNLFTGWEDVDLSLKGHKEAIRAGNSLRKEGYDFDVCYTSYLKRAIHTLDHILEQMDREWLPVYKNWRLNERHYGKLQGLNKEETSLLYGENQVQQWRRSYDTTPPLLTETDSNEFCRNMKEEEIPKGESLKMTSERVIPYFKNHILKDVEEGKRVLVVAHGNTIRAIVKYLNKLDESEIINVNIPTGLPLIYEFDHNMKVIDKHYLEDDVILQKKVDDYVYEWKN